MFGGISNINESISNTKVVYNPKEWAKYKATMLADPGFAGTGAVLRKCLRVIMLHGAKAGDIIWYYKTDDKKGGNVTINPEEIGLCKYKEMLMSTVKDGLAILGYGNDEKIK